MFTLYREVRKNEDEAANAESIFIKLGLPGKETIKTYSMFLVLVLVSVEVAIEGLCVVVEIKVVYPCQLPTLLVRVRRRVFLPLGNLHFDLLETAQYKSVSGAQEKTRNGSGRRLSRKKKSSRGRGARWGMGGRRTSRQEYY